MKTYEEIINSFSIGSEEEEKALKYYEEHGDYSFVSHAAPLIDASTFIHEGMLVLRHHPRFCYITKHSHNYLEINYALKGSTTQILDSSKITLNQGELLFISKNSSHEFLPAKKDDLLLNFIILPEFFDFIIPFIDRNGAIKKFVDNLLSNKTDNNSILFHVAKDEAIQNLMKNIIIAYGNHDETTNNIIKHYFLLLIFELLKRSNMLEETMSSNYETVLTFKIKNYIENNYAKGSLADFAKSINEDYNYLSKKIKKLTDFSFQQLIERQRIKAAKTLLLNTNSNIEEIAYHVGYNNLTFFYNLFKKYEGVTPSQFKKQKNIVETNPDTHQD